MKFTLKALRANTGLTMEEAAEMIGIKKDTLFNYENGYTIPKQNVAERLATFYKVDLNDVFFADKHGLTVFQKSFIQENKKVQ